MSPGCLKCGSFFIEETLFCKICFTEEIEPRINAMKVSHVEKNRHFYLLEWFKNDGFFIDQLVYRLKSDNSPAAWAFYSKLLKYLCPVNFKNYHAIVPIPGSKSSSVHSLVFAQELAKLTGLPVLTLLQKNNSFEEQKKGTAAQRSRQKMACVKEQKFEQFTKFVFVDDVLTTGQSFFQSNLALNGQFENIILTLFYRPKLQ